MKAILNRVGRLEQERLTKNRVERERGVRVIASFDWKGYPNLETSTCVRSSYTAGGLMEFFTIEGNASLLSEDELDRFAEQFPIVRHGK